MSSPALLSEGAEGGLLSWTFLVARHCPCSIACASLHPLPLPLSLLLDSSLLFPLNKDSWTGVRPPGQSKVMSSSQEWIRTWAYLGCHISCTIVIGKIQVERLKNLQIWTLSLCNNTEKHNDTLWKGTKNPWSSDCDINTMYEAIYKNSKMSHGKMALGEKKKTSALGCRAWPTEGFRSVRICIWRVIHSWGRIIVTWLYITFFLPHLFLFSTSTK